LGLPFRIAAEKRTTARLPMLLCLGERRVEAVLFLRSSEKGSVAAMALLNEKGKPLWPQPHSQGVWQPADVPNWWNFYSSVSEGFTFVADVLGLEICTPGPLVALAGFGQPAYYTEELLRSLAREAGCVAEKVSKRAYRVRFADGYRGAPDASWFVVREGEQFYFRAQDVPVRPLLAAMVELVGGALVEGADLAGAKVVVGGLTPSLAQALDLICECSTPQLVWWSRDGTYRFELKQKN